MSSLSVIPMDSLVSQKQINWAREVRVAKHELPLGRAIVNYKNCLFITLIQ